MNKYIREEDIPAPVSWLCVDCGVNTAPGLATRAEMHKFFYVEKRQGAMDQVVDDKSEVYAVRGAVWIKAGMPDGCLCIGCLENRLGRRLKPKDFDRGHSLNQMPGTKRLLNRRGHRAPMVYR
jgi:hypothetical protein